MYEDDRIEREDRRFHEAVENGWRPSRHQPSSALIERIAEIEARYQAERAAEPVCDRHGRRGHCSLCSLRGQR